MRMVIEQEGISSHICLLKTTSLATPLTHRHSKPPPKRKTNISFSKSFLLGCPWNLVYNYLVSWVVTYLGDLQPTYIGVIIYLLSTMDIPVIESSWHFWTPSDVPDFLLQDISGDGRDPSHMCEKKGRSTPI